MIGPSGTVRVMVATKPIDFRNGMEELALLVTRAHEGRSVLGCCLCESAKRADRIQMIFWDGTCLCLFAKRLEEGSSAGQKIEDGVMPLSAAELSALPEMDLLFLHLIGIAALLHRPAQTTRSQALEGSSALHESARCACLNLIHPPKPED